jgi:glycosyltransferase involved in cell wall biosynthesis
MGFVSIIVNVCNGAATLRETLASAVGQTYRDWEMIVWDDRSTDGSAEIVREFNDARIRYVLAPEATSLGKARDQAMRLASGEWLAFLDQDDLWMPEKLEWQLGLTDSPQVGLVYGRTVCFYPSGRQRDFDQFHEFSALPEGDILGELLGKGCFIAMSSAVIRRSAVERSGGIPTGVNTIPDYWLYLATCQRYSARTVQDVVCRYRVHSGSMTKAYRRESLEETLALVEKWREQQPAAEFGRRQAGISTALALEEMRDWTTAAHGVRRLLNEGSLGWLAGRPFVHLRRIAERRLRRPSWKQSASVL